ncbi:MAG: sulfotransferase [Leptolyngbyaceae cyanobacterium SM1_1_3]|nr:sulfotransferase [Leptolyngbyaceae cyanobacterium SM1_1_3]NJN02091.1 sulfotransferase [Leptolyngbyaceae cyanobacterium RM1_1_2]NJO09699.1 sulfotransferase [Leptolyngbyaceae cyanobacterium SL_1_1]
MKKHIVFTLGRSGSNHLANLLNAHPQVTNYGEILGDWTVPYKLYKATEPFNFSVPQYLDYIYSSQAIFYMAHAYSALSHIQKAKPVNFKLWSQVETTGVKDFSLNFIKRNIPSYLKDREDILVINLYRENQLKRLISLKKMEASGVIALQNKHSQVKQQRIFLDPGETIHDLQTFDMELRQHQALVEQIPEHRVLQISYEDFFGSKESQNHHREKIFSFLGVSSFEVASSHQKITPDKLDYVVENHEEILDTLSKTEFAKYL